MMKSVAEICHHSIADRGTLETSKLHDLLMDYVRFLCCRQSSGSFCMARKSIMWGEDEVRN